MRLTSRLGRAAAGFMLTELMVATALGLFLIAGLLAVMTHWLGADGRLLQRSRLNQSLGGVLAVMRNEVGRAGFWGRAGNAPDAVNGYQGLLTPEPGCLLYRYDRHGDDPDGVPSPDDMSGFRLKDGILQYRSRTRACTQDACDSCGSGIWSALTDPDFMRVDMLEFNVERRTGSDTTLIDVRVSIRGTLVRGDATLDLESTILAGAA